MSGSGKELDHSKKSSSTSLYFKLLSWNSLFPDCFTPTPAQLKLSGRQFEVGNGANFVRNSRNGQIWSVKHEQICQSTTALRCWHEFWEARLDFLPTLNLLPWNKKVTEFCLLLNDANTILYIFQPSTISQIGEVRLLLILIDYYFLTVKRGLYYCIRTESILQTKKGPAMQVQWNYKESPFQIEFFTTA